MRHKHGRSTTAQFDQDNFHALITSLLDRHNSIEIKLKEQIFDLHSLGSLSIFATEGTFPDSPDSTVDLPDPQITALQIAGYIAGLDFNNASGLMERVEEPALGMYASVVVALGQTLILNATNADERNELTNKLVGVCGKYLQGDAQKISYFKKFLYSSFHLKLLEEATSILEPYVNSTSVNSTSVNSTSSELHISPEPTTTTTPITNANVETVSIEIRNAFGILDQAADADSITLLREALQCHFFQAAGHLPKREARRLVEAFTPQQLGGNNNFTKWMKKYVGTPSNNSFGL